MECDLSYCNRREDSERQRQNEHKPLREQWRQEIEFDLSNLKSVTDPWNGNDKLGLFGHSFEFLAKARNVDINCAS